MTEELKPHHYWREDRITGRQVVITPDEYEQWGKDNQPSEAYRPAFTCAQQPSQGGEAVEVVAWRVSHPDTVWKVYEKNPESWAAGDFEIQTLMTVAQHQRIVAALTAPPSPDAELVELLREASQWFADRDIDINLARDINAKLASLELNP